MESVHGTSAEHSRLLGVVRGVRARYRAKLSLRGAAITIAGTWIVLVAFGVRIDDPPQVHGWRSTRLAGSSPLWRSSA